MSLSFPLCFVVPVGVLAFAAGCPTSLSLTPPVPTLAQPTPPPVDPTDPVDPVIPGCAVDVVPIAVLPRTSNDEVRRLVEDLTGTAAPTSFASWTPLAQVLGFDTMTESRIDTQTLGVQLGTMSTVADTLVNTPSLMAACPVAAGEPPLCALHERYDSTAQFSGTQGQDCWSYVDNTGAQLTFNVAEQRWGSDEVVLLLWNNGAHPGPVHHAVRRFTAPVDGVVNLDVSASDGDPGGGDGVNVVVLAAGNTVARSVLVNGAAIDPITVSLPLRRGDTVDVAVERGGDNNYDSTNMNVVVDFRATASGGTRTWSNCGAAVVATVAGRAWRRPLHADELADFAQVFDSVLASATQNGQVGGFADALTATLTAALLSPNLHYKPEFVPGGFWRRRSGVSHSVAIGVVLPRLVPRRRAVGPGDAKRPRRRRGGPRAGRAVVDEQRRPLRRTLRWPVARLSRAGVWHADPAAAGDAQRGPRRLCRRAQRRSAC